ncbi:hypothetical protein COCC4DRAFT_180366 [Bipolaris maydis ATCC 48331]|uniref:Uncharacterized protein n=2 Tax=Cochliobolus heterostrophus TaxID=5016 RepID=M2UCY6_COCH5|nr:uncharacterized protein COCC4DRAFT_180366 [Bipolaris maydis ATCC 48331]EMD85767.1 hypothetical protein COCHEDRAFT_1207743 [Bipolaris maydis C5]ENH99846.1 hypothetical protein COCC4DRAFT_180366 [Bipolaris maydis ATCC 48331]KAJ6208490.1 hypothetical protein PSV09DRAFT_1207743 [Bipolaris maydis]
MAGDGAGGWLSLSTLLLFRTIAATRLPQAWHPISNTAHGVPANAQPDAASSTAARHASASSTLASPARYPIHMAWSRNRRCPGPVARMALLLLLLLLPFLFYVLPARVLLVHAPNHCRHCETLAGTLHMAPLHHTPAAIGARPTLASLPRPDRSLSHLACPAPEPRQRPFLLPPLSLLQMTMPSMYGYIHIHMASCPPLASASTTTRSLPLPSAPRPSVSCSSARIATRPTAPVRAAQSHHVFTNRSCPGLGIASSLLLIMNGL